MISVIVLRKMSNKTLSLKKNMIVFRIGSINEIKLSNKKLYISIHKVWMNQLINNHWVIIVKQLRINNILKSNTLNKLNFVTSPTRWHDLISLRDFKMKFIKCHLNTNRCFIVTYALSNRISSFNTHYNHVGSFYPKCDKNSKVSKLKLKVI